MRVTRGIDCPAKGGKGGKKGGGGGGERKEKGEKEEKRKVRRRLKKIFVSVRPESRMKTCNYRQHGGCFGLVEPHQCSVADLVNITFPCSSLPMLRLGMYV